MNPPNSASSNREVPSLPKLLVVDACVLLNLHASGQVEEILASLPCRCLVSPYASREALWYLGLTEDNASLTRRGITLEPLITGGLLEIVNLTSEEQTTFVELAEHLDDGEAASGALAISRSASVATDDLKALRVFARLTPPLRTLGTPTLLRFWAETSGIDRSEVAVALQAIRTGARFLPADSDRDAAWWKEQLREISLH